jgi:hypothetical protein
MQGREDLGDTTTAVVAHEINLVDLQGIEELSSICALAVTETS